MIKDGKTTLAVWEPSPNFQPGRCKPEAIVVHYTGGWKHSSLPWLRSSASKVSAHLFISRSGHLHQLVRFEDRAWHAGTSVWEGRRDLNSWSIGIELECLGLLSDSQRRQVQPEQQWVDDRGQSWHRFTRAQYRSLVSVCLELSHHYPIAEVLGHSDVSPGRKIDPGPALYLVELAALCVDQRDRLSEGV